MDKLEFAMHETAHKDLPLLAKKMGMNEQSLRNKVSPTNEHAKFSVQEWRSMMMITSDFRSLEVLAEQLGFHVKTKEQAQCSTILSSLLMFNKEQGDIASAIFDALEDGKITPREKVNIENEIRDAQKALDIVKASVNGFKEK